MALSRIEGDDELYVGGIWALRRSDTLEEKNIKTVVSLFAFHPDHFKNFKEEPWSEYGKQFRHLMINIDDVDDADLLVELPRAVRFIDEGLRSQDSAAETKQGGVFIHCAAGKSRSVSTTIAYLLWRYPERFDPDAGKGTHSRKDTAEEAVAAALALIRRTRPMAEPNDGFMDQLHLWWAMGCPDDDVEGHPGYQRWAYMREVEENVAVGQAPTRLRFEDEAAPKEATEGDKRHDRVSLRCKMCRRTLATTPFIAAHKPASTATGAPRSWSSAARSGGASALSCSHYVEPLSWMRGELEKGQLNGRLGCPGARCGAAVGRYDWKGLRCGCGAWVTPAFSLQRGRVDEERVRGEGVGAGEGKADEEKRRGLGIRMPPGRGGNL